MEKRKWLWKRRSSLDKSPGETETSGSMSSQSEKCLEDQECTKGSPNHNNQSPEVTSKALGDEAIEKSNSTSKNSLLKKLSEADKEEFLLENLREEPISDGSSIQGGHSDEAASNGQEENESVKILKDKLSAALINLSLKDELVNQHSKVAEEAVEGWEKAESEAAVLKQQLETAVENNSALEARFSQVDQALKECVRQLRLLKDDQERKISEAVEEKNKEFELAKSKLEFLERENKRLNLELVSQTEELEIRTIERDLSTKAAETVSKQNLESIKMVAKLESECRKLKAVSRKSVQKSPSASSYSFDSEAEYRNMSGFMSSELARSDSWLDQFKNEKPLSKSLSSSSGKIDFMDDFLEMEKLAAMPENGHLPKSEDTESLLREELNMIKCRASELEDKVQKMEAEKVELENLQVELIETKMKLEDLESELQEANELKLDYESYANDLKLEARAMMSKIEQLEAEIDRQRVSSEKLSDRCQELENELHIKNEEIEVERGAAVSSEKLSARCQEMENELNMKKQELQAVRAAVASSEKLSARCQELENKLHMKNEELESLRGGVELEKKERALDESRKRLDELENQYKEAVMKFEKQEAASKCEVEEKETALAESRNCLDQMQIKLKEAEMKLETQIVVYDNEIKEKVTALAQSQERLEELQVQLKEAENKLHEENVSKERLLSDLTNARGEVETMSTQIDTLQSQIEQEHGFSAELSAKCEELEKELKQKDQDLGLQQNVPAVIEQKINQEDVANAAEKLAECQKTIASLGNQLKSLATLEDFLIDTASIPGFSGSTPLVTNGGNEMWKLHSNNVYHPQKRRDDHFQDPEGLHTFSKYVDGDIIDSSSSSSTNLFNSEKRGNGFEKLFPMRRG